MLNQERIEILNNMVKEGNCAKETLDRYNNLIEQRECLENAMSRCNDCRKVTVEYAYNSSAEIKINFPNFAIEQIKKIIENEIEELNIKIDSFS